MLVWNTSHFQVRLAQHIRDLLEDNKIEPYKKWFRIRITHETLLSAQTGAWSTWVLFPRIFKSFVTRFASHETPQLIASGKLAFDERVVLHRAEWSLDYHEHGRHVSLHPSRPPMTAQMLKLRIENASKLKACSPTSTPIHLPPSS